MEYLFTEKEDFSFLSSGNVIKHFSGMPCFPVRLTLELFERAYHIIGKDMLSVYDPCCGSGFSLTVMGMIKQDKINTLYGSDIADNCIEATLCNAAMVKRSGMISARDKLLSDADITEMRRQQLNESVDKLLPFLTNDMLDTRIFKHDILSGTPDIPEAIDYVFADIPYGNMTEWKVSSEAQETPIQLFLGNIAKVMSAVGVLAVSGTKELRIQTELFKRIDKIRAGKRLVYILRKV